MQEEKIFLIVIKDSTIKEKNVIVYVELSILYIWEVRQELIQDVFIISEGDEKIVNGYLIVT